MGACNSSAVCATSAFALVFKFTSSGDWSSDDALNDDVEGDEWAAADVTIVARKGGEVYNKRCLFKLLRPELEAEASRRSNDSLRPVLGLEELARRDDEDAKSLHGLDMVVEGELSHHRRGDGRGHGDH